MIREPEIIDQLSRSEEYQDFELVDFRNRLRIESAKRLLTVPGPGVSEIAYQVGFQSLTQFNRLFRRIVGKSPTRFRRSLLKAESHVGQATSVN